MIEHPDSVRARLDAMDDERVTRERERDRRADMTPAPVPVFYCALAATGRWCAVRCGHCRVVGMDGRG